MLRAPDSRRRAVFGGVQMTRGGSFFLRRTAGSIDLPRGPGSAVLLPAPAQLCRVSEAVHDGGCFTTPRRCVAFCPFQEHGAIRSLGTSSPFFATSVAQRQTRGMSEFFATSVAPTLNQGHE